MKLNMERLIHYFDLAATLKMNYIGIRVESEGFPKPEVIINERENFKPKLEYYMKAYNDDLTLKSFSGVKITGISFANTYEEIKWDLKIK